MDGGLRELDPVEEEVSLARKVKLRKLERHPLVDVLVEGAEGEHGHRRVDHVVHGHEERFKDGLREL